MPRLTIATRESALALWQANHVKLLLETRHPDLQCEILGMTTQGDRDKSSPLSQMGGKGVFVKELETALLDGTADIAVHSMKDVPGELPRGLGIHCMVERADARDAFISRRYGSLSEMPAGAVVGSSSLRRVLQLREAHPGLRFSELRGNVDTRMRKLDDGEYDAIILAVAGMTRLGRGAEITAPIDTSVSLPAAGQGAVGIECRSDDARTRELVAAINDERTSLCVGAERTVTLALGATCNLPIAVHAVVDGDITIRAFVSDSEGAEVIREQSRGPGADADEIAQQLGETLIRRGALKLTGG